MHGGSSVTAESLLELKGPGCLNNTHPLSLSAYTANEAAGHPLSGPVSRRTQGQQGAEAEALGEAPVFLVISPHCLSTNGM